MLNDFRYVLRTLYQNPAFAIVVILSIAIAVGANSTIFSYADGLLMRPLPVPNPASILTVNTEGPDGDLADGMSYPNYRDLRERTKSFDGLVAYKVARVAASKS